MAKAKMKPNQGISHWKDCEDIKRYSMRYYTSLMSGAIYGKHRNIPINIAACDICWLSTGVRPDILWFWNTQVSIATYMGNNNYLACFFAWMLFQPRLSTLSKKKGTRKKTATKNINYKTTHG